MIKPIITSMLDDDFYSLTVGALIHKLYSDVDVEYEFFNRDNTPFPEGFARHLELQLEFLSLLSYTKSDLDYLSHLTPVSSPTHYFSSSYIDWLSSYQFDPGEVLITQDNDNLKIKIIGKWERTIMWEVKLLRIISALYFKLTGQLPTIDYKRVAREKADKIVANKIKVADFGSRRAYSPEVHKEVVEILYEYGRIDGKFGEDSGFTSTSNIQLAKELNIPPSGTNSHQWYMFHAAAFGIALCNQVATNVWLREYRNLPLRTVLPDTYTTEFFLETLTEEVANRIDTFRQDSANPIEMATLIAQKLTKFGMTDITRRWQGQYKNVLFSDALTINKAVSIDQHFRRDCFNKLFGIGTHISNDVGVRPLAIVIKPTRFRIPYYNPNVIQDDDGWVESAKLSDDPAKNSGTTRAIKDSLHQVHYAMHVNTKLVSA